jgi:putative DNA primase/helicase
MATSKAKVMTVEILEQAPEPLPDGLPPVPAFDYELLPPSLRPRIQDIAERMQCPPDFVAVGMMVCLASLIGRRVGIAPKEHDDWIVIPNLWGAVIAGPGFLKSPALAEVMKDLRVLEAKAADYHADDMADFKANQLVFDQSEKVAKEEIRKLLRQGKKADAKETALDIEDPADHEPACARYIVNDATVEKLGEILKQNPMGVLLFRDELTGFFRNLDKHGRESDRAFYLECWNGDGGFTYDRIGRGTLHIDAACLSILGGIQPGPLSEIVRRASGAGEDGLLQRFQLLVHPDTPKTWRNVDRAPDMSARDSVAELITRLDGANAVTVDSEIADRPCLRFDAKAQELFNEWRETLELRLRSGKEHALMEAHLAKYRSMVPALALILHLTEHDTGPVAYAALERAIAWSEYLEPHARRVYAPGISPDMTAARLLAERIEDGDLSASFTARDIYRHGWSGLSTRDAVVSGLNILEDYNWLRSERIETGGKDRTDYHLHKSFSQEVNQ